MIHITHIINTVGIIIWDEVSVQMGNRETVNSLQKTVTSKAFLAQSRYAISAVEMRIREIGEAMAQKEGRTVVNALTSRIKEPESIRTKLLHRGYEATYENALEKLNDILGVRVICPFIDDIYALVDYLKKEEDITVLKEKDYIKNIKASGYRSFHLIILIPVYTGGEEKKIKIEIQFRTVAMNFWADLDHELRYKKESQEAESIGVILRHYARIMKEADERIQEQKERMLLAWQ